ncbi:uncharacterized protein LOC129229273 isoform X2 [Uloborus diversus]|uniref:uncharacterized protein LOC129229273 isoform X2 n=1 Tax=Uloborus diversus TaxID=327109 RepID=UPI00240A0C45|nr:uncharacterized protein LOC129229273 isoform X2 [Uloborus diversus]
MQGGKESSENKNGYQFLTPKTPLHRSLSSASTVTSSGLFRPVQVENLGDINAENKNSDYKRVAMSVSSSSSLESRTPKSDKNSPNLGTTPKSAMWVLNTNSSSTSSEVSSSISVLSPSTIEFPNSCSEFSNSSGDDTMLRTIDEPLLQRFIASDGRYVYGYKDSDELRIHPLRLYASLSDRESHNEKERKRRSRVAEACSTLRHLIPGISEKTDKATVFEAAARYLQYIRKKFGTEFDEAYCLKYFPDESCDKIIG